MFRVATLSSITLAMGARPESWSSKQVAREEPKHTLRVCNAYPYSKPMNIFLNEVELYGSMEYKECDDFLNLHLMPGDQLRFKTEVDHHQHSAGIFEISDMPHYPSTLLLVISRHDQQSNSVGFESHVFRESENAQIAVIDTYKGTNKARVQIMHKSDLPGAATKPETLPFGSVHRINTGSYNVAMDETFGTQDNTILPLVALPTHDYVILRVGIDDHGEGEKKHGKLIPGDASYPEDLVVFPLSDTERLHSSATTAGLTGAVLTLLGVLASGL